MTAHQIEAAVTAACVALQRHRVHVTRTQMREAMEVALPAAEAAAWEPIESAPKDGTPVFLLSKRYENRFEDGEVVVHQPRAHIGKWNPEGTSWTDEFGDLEGEICTLTVTGIWESGGGWFQPNEVTHWRPLPSPPEQEGA